jgi:hypothetical protein
MRYFVLWSKDSAYDYQGYASWERKEFTNFAEAVTLVDLVGHEDFAVFLFFRVAGELICLKRDLIASEWIVNHKPDGDVLNHILASI